MALSALLTLSRPVGPKLRQGGGRHLLQNLSRARVQPITRAIHNYRDDSDFFINPASYLLQHGVSPTLSSMLASNWPTSAPTAKHIALDVIEKPHLYEVKGDLPGIREEDVKLSVDGDVLSISVENLGKEKEETKEEGGIKVHRIERTAAFARRAIRLPESADTENIAADLNHGVLTVHIPKREKTPRQRTIPIGKKAGTKAISGNGASKAVADHAEDSKNIAVETAAHK